LGAIALVMVSAVAREPIVGAMLPVGSRGNAPDREVRGYIS